MNAPDPVKARLPAGLLSAMAAQPSRTRAQGRRRAIVLYAFVGGVMLALFQVSGGFGHGAGRPADITARLVLGTAVLALAASVVALGRGRSMTGRSSAVLALVIAAIPVLLFAWQTRWFGTYVEPFQRFGWRCIGLTLVMGGAMLGAIVALRRRTVPTNETLHGAAAGAASGAVATVLVDAWCPLANNVHVAQGHLAPLVVLTIAGAILGRTILGVRSAHVSSPSKLRR